MAKYIFETATRKDDMTALVSIHIEDDVKKEFRLSVDPFYSWENITRLRNSVAHMEATGSTVHEIDFND